MITEKDLLTDEQLTAIGRERDAAVLGCMAALGVVDEKTDLFDAHINIWPKVYNDRVVRERDDIIRRETGQSQYFSQTVAIVAAMTPAERIALRDRILGVKEFPRQPITAHAD